MDNETKIKALEFQLAHMTKLHGLAESAMHSAHAAMSLYRDMAQESSDEILPLWEVVFAAQNFVVAQEFDSTRRPPAKEYRDMKAALANHVIVARQRRVASLNATQTDPTAARAGDSEVPQSPVIAFESFGDPRLVSDVRADARYRGCGTLAGDSLDSRPTEDL